MGHNILKWFFNLKFWIALVAFGGILCFVGEGNLINRMEQWQEIGRLRSEIDEYNRRFEQDKQTLEALKNDEEAIKEVARERYYMKTENEDIFIIEDEENEL